MGHPPTAQHLLTGLERGGDGLHQLAQRALELRAGAAPRRFDGCTLGAVFLDPSLRTRTSLTAAAVALGVHPIVLSPGSTAWDWEMEDGVVMDGDRPEHVREAIPVLSSYVDVLAVRSFRHDIARFAALSSRPLINLESRGHHPLQGLADAATWQARLGPDLRGKRLVLTWAPHPRVLPTAVPNQVLLTAAALGLDVTVAHPAQRPLDVSVMMAARSLASSVGGRVSVSHSATIGDADVVYAKSWGGPVEGGAAWTVTPERLGDAGFMHCLPVRRNVVVTDAVLDGAQSWVEEQAALRRWTAMAALEQVLS